MLEGFVKLTLEEAEVKPIVIILASVLSELTRRVQFHPPVDLYDAADDLIVLCGLPPIRMAKYSIYKPFLVSQGTEVPARSRTQKVIVAPGSDHPVGQVSNFSQVHVSAYGSATRYFSHGTGDNFVSSLMRGLVANGLQEKCVDVFGVPFSVNREYQINQACNVVVVGISPFLAMCDACSGLGKGAGIAGHCLHCFGRGTTLGVNVGPLINKFIEEELMES